jgi:hypothetical protein
MLPRGKSATFDVSERVKEHIKNKQFTIDLPPPTIPEKNVRRANKYYDRGFTCINASEFKRALGEMDEVDIDPEFDRFTRGTAPQTRFCEHHHPVCDDVPSDRVRLKNINVVICRTCKRCMNNVFFRIMFHSSVRARSPGEEEDMKRNVLFKLLTPRLAFRQFKTKFYQMRITQWDEPWF